MKGRGKDVALWEGTGHYMAVIGIHGIGDKGSYGGFVVHGERGSESPHGIGEGKG